MPRHARRTRDAAGIAGSGSHRREPGRGRRALDYWPLTALVVVCALGAIAMIGADGEWTMRAFMHAYMGLFLLVFALLKLFDPGQFADGLAMYDLLASRLHAYGYVYPLIELALALAYLAHLAPATTYAATIAVFGFGALGVANALRKGLDVECACMGNVLGVPLSTVALSEDLLMVAMAAMLLMM